MKKMRNSGKSKWIDARSEVMDYLEEHYGIDTREECEEIEDQCTWCYGIDKDSVRKLIEKAQ